MNLSLPTGRTGQLLAVGAPVLAILALWVGGAMPIIGWYDDRDADLMRRSALAGRMAMLASDLPVLRERAAPAVRTGTDNDALLVGDSDAIASASLQERLQAMFLQAGVALNSIETVPGENAHQFRRIRLRISFNASWPVLIALLKSLHVATPILLVDEIQVQPALHRISTAPGTYDVTCSVFAFRAATTEVASK